MNTQSGPTTGTLSHVHAHPEACNEEKDVETQVCEVVSHQM